MEEELNNPVKSSPQSMSMLAAIEETLLSIVEKAETKLNESLLSSPSSFRPMEITDETTTTTTTTTTAKTTKTSSLAVDDTQLQTLTHEANNLHLNEDGKRPADQNNNYMSAAKRLTRSSSSSAIDSLLLKHEPGGCGDGGGVSSSDELDQLEDEGGHEHDEDLQDLKEEIAELDGLFVSSLTSTTNPHGGSLNASSSHTFRKTEWDVKKLESYVRLVFGDMTEVEKISPTLLDMYLKGFFEFAKKSDGMEYEPESLIGFMNSFERYLKTKGYPESLLRSDAFKESRLVLKKKREMVRSIGKFIRTKTKDSFYILLYHRNLLKEKGMLGRDSPDSLLAEV